MKVILPVLKNDSTDQIANGFHNAAYVCIYNTKNKNFEWLKSTEISINPGNLSIELKRNDIRHVISYQLPFMALGLFIESGIQVLKARPASIMENIELFMQNKLEAMTFSNPNMGNSCNTSCTSCNISCN